VRLLALESSGRLGGAAIYENGRVLVERVLGPEKARAYEAALVPLVETMLAEANLAPRDLDAVAVSVGPGSYTGLRVGCAAAKSLAWALRAPLAAVPTLLALAEDARDAAPPDATLAPVTDACQGRVYARVFAPDGTDSGDLLVTPEGLAGRVTGRALLFGSGVARYREALASAANGRFTLADGPASPRPGTIARLGAGLIERNETVNAHDLAPVYLRRSEAEEKLERQERPHG